MMMAGGLRCIHVHALRAIWFHHGLSRNIR